MADEDLNTGGDADNPGNNDGNGAGADTPPGANNAPKTFTQADVDRIAGDARKSARSKATADLLKELELEDVNGLKTLVTDARQRQQDNMSELEQAQARIAELETADSGLKEAQDSVTAYETAVKSRVEALTKDLSIPKYVVALFERMSPLEQLTYINDNRKEFSKPSTPNLNAGDGGGNATTPKTAEEKQDFSNRMGVRVEYVE